MECLSSGYSRRRLVVEVVDRQPELFTLDYFYSLNAAFTRDDFRRVAADTLAGRAEVYATFIAPFMVAVKSAPRAELDGDLRARLGAVRDALPAHHQVDVKDLISWFGMGGLRSQALT